MKELLFDVEKRLAKFSSNLYFSYVYDKVVKRHEQIEDEFFEAYLNQDTAEMKRLTSELAEIEAAFNTSATITETIETPS
tara:strand:- start:1813 stop:2052 length:240 start_codon:yes stop_codon:yes gene_type:complete